ncbi:MAG TPA: hypothetical protein VJB41_00060 [Patescibacteria group bacterium]|nr:hypothetical protein [Patescibacteria group bacterium]
MSQLREWRENAPLDEGDDPRLEGSEYQRQGQEAQRIRESIEKSIKGILINETGEVTEERAREILLEIQEILQSKNTSQGEIGIDQNMLPVHIFKLTVGGKLLSFNVMFGMKNGSPHYDIRSTSIEGINLLKKQG